MSTATKRPRNAQGQFVKLAEGKGKKAPNMSEVGTISSQLGGLSIMAYNPDTLAKAKGGLEIYQKMFAEPHVKAALIQKKAALLSVPWDIEAGTDDEQGRQIADFVRWNLREFLEDSFEVDLYDMLDALDSGFSVSEMIWAQVEEGPYKGLFAYRKFKAKNPAPYVFDMDQFGNVKPDGLINETISDKAKQRLPMDKFIIHSFMKRYESPYGQSDLRAAYRAYWIKDTAWKLRTVYMERFSGNNLMGKYKKNDKEGQKKLLDIFKSWRTETGIAIPHDMDVDVLQIATSSETEFQRSIKDCNKEILIGILGVTLTVDEGAKTGARAMGEVHKDVADLFVKFLEIQLTSDINKQLVRPLVDTNYPEVHTYPKFVFASRSPITADDIQKLKTAGVPISDDFVYQKFRIPKPRDVKEAQPQIFQYHIETGVVTPNEVRARLGLPPREGGDVPMAKEPLQPEPQASNASTAAPSVQAARFAEPAQTIMPAGPYSRELNRFEEFAEIPRVDRRLKVLEEKALELSRPAYDDIFAQIIDKVEKKGLLTGGSLQDAAGIKVNPSKLKGQLFKAILTSGLVGRADVVQETQNQGFEYGKIAKFAEVSFDWEVLDTTFTPEQAMKFFSGKVPMTKEAFDKLVGASMDRAFFVAGLEAQSVTREAHILIMEAHMNGMSLKDFTFKLNALKDKYARPEYEREGATSQSTPENHAQTVFRNNMMQSYNGGRREMYNDPDVAAYFPAFMYSAIVEADRTTEICKRLDGMIRLKDDPVWQVYWPQNHHGCRSTVVSINKYDFKRDMITEVPSVSPAPGFGG